MSPPPVLDLTFPWPPKELGGNSTKHWTARSKATKAQRTRARKITEAEVNKLDEVILNELEHERLEAEWFFSPPDRRRRDSDNMLRSAKSIQDGVFDALPENVDDCQVDRVIITKCPPTKEGHVRLTITVR